MFSLEIIVSICNSLFQHYSVSFLQPSHMFYIQFEWGGGGIFLYFKSRSAFVLAVMQMFCKNNFLFIRLRLLSIFEAFSFCYKLKPLVFTVYARLVL
jgi:hypothetical protein